MSEQTLARISIYTIRPNPDQPRRTFEPGALQELANSILAAGRLYQPITVRPIPAEGEVRYEIICGERRWRAHKLLVEYGHSEFAAIVCHVEDMSETERDVAAIVENLQRADVNPVEEANAFQRLLDKGQSLEQIAEKVGIDPFRVRERLAIVKLDPQVQSLIRSGQIAPTCAVALAKVDHRRQCEIIRKIAAGKIAPSWNEITAAVQVLEERDAQTDFLGAAPVASKEELHVLSVMERKILGIKTMVSCGFKDGECIIARKVDPNRTRKMAEELDLIRLAVDRMSRELKNAAVQHELIS